VLVTYKIDYPASYSYVQAFIPVFVQLAVAGGIAVVALCWHFWFGLVRGMREALTEV
jgi:hypothetical protein